MSAVALYVDGVAQGRACTERRARGPGKACTEPILKYEAKSEQAPKKIEKECLEVYKNPESGVKDTKDGFQKKGVVKAVQGTWGAQSRVDSECAVEWLQ